MEMMNGYASCLIKARQHHIGFPSLFSHYPDGMKHEEMAAIHELVQEAMDQTRDIPEGNDNIRRLVIGTGKYMILGISGYANHLAAKAPNVPYELVDFMGRSCPGFIGFVWDLNKVPLHSVGFPSLSAFGLVFYELILKHWADSDNSKWASQTREGVTIPYQYSVSAEPLTIPTKSLPLNHGKKTISSFDRSCEQALLYQAISEAMKKQVVSICTDLYLDSEKGSSFLNMTADHKGAPVEEIANVKYAGTKPVQRATNISHDNAGVDFPPNDILKAECEKNDEKQEDQSKNILTKLISQAIQGGRPSQSTNIVHLVVIMDPIGKAEALLTELLNRIIATIKNPPYNYKEVELQGKYTEATSKYKATVTIPENMDISEFRELCRNVLEHYRSNRLIIADKRGHCWIKTRDYKSPFRVLV